VTRWAPLAIVVVLLAATAVAFATTERQKLEKTPFAVLHVERYLSPRHSASTIDLRFRRPHLITLQLVDANERVVGTLAREHRVERGRVQFQWRGRGIRDGVYRPKLTLDDGREFTLPTDITVDSTAPTATLVSYRPHVVRRRGKPEVRIAYRVSEPAHVLVFANGKRDVLGGAKSLQFAVNWQVRRNGRRLRPGRYRLQLAAVDLAGNVGPRTHVFVVRVR
jgi:hypothetical protein